MDRRDVTQSKSFRALRAFVVQNPKISITDRTGKTFKLEAGYVFVILETDSAF
jgi:hypothetical protein